MCRSLHDEVAGRRDDEAGETCCGGDRFIQRGRIDNGKHITVAMENVGFSSVCPFRIGISTRNGPAARAVGTAAALVEWIHLLSAGVCESVGRRGNDAKRLTGCSGVDNDIIIVIIIIVVAAAAVVVVEHDTDEGGMVVDIQRHL